MIVIESLPTPATAGRSALSKRELQRFLKLAMQAVPVRGTVNVLLTGDAAIRDLNRRFRKKNKATDVLSFPAADSDAMPGRGHRFAGDLAISLDAAARQSENFGHALSLEVKILILHGLLHLAGLDHEADSGQMAERERELREQFDLPPGLIQRCGLTSPRSTEKPRRNGAADKLNRPHQTHISEARHAAPASVANGGRAKKGGKAR